MSILGDELLTGELVRLTRFQKSDLPQLAVWFSDVEFMRYLSRRPAYGEPIEALEKWYESTLDDHAEPFFAIRTLSDNQLVGICDLKDIRWASRHCLTSIGIGDGAQRGRGYGTDAFRVLLKYAFMELNLNCVALEVFSYNAPAIASYRRIGFRHDGVMRAYLYRDGVYYDMHLMSMTRAEWDDLYGAAAKPAPSGSTPE